jgi:hypothetical protein
LDFLCYLSGVLEDTPSPRRGISADVIWGKYRKGEEKKGENVKENGRKWKKKRKGEEEELRQKGHNKSKKRSIMEG